jgi:hypothetical protein
MEVSAARILTDAVWRARILDGDYSKIRKPQSVPAVAHGSQAVPVQPERFPADSKMQVADFLHVTGDDANSVIDEVNAIFGEGKGTRSIVRKAIVAAGEHKPFFHEVLSGKPKKPSVAEVMSWVKTRVSWHAAHAVHGSPEQLVGGEIAETFLGGKMQPLRWNAGAVGAALFDALKQYPNAWAENVQDPRGGYVGAYFSTGDLAFRDEFSNLASAITPEQYGP